MVHLIKEVTNEKRARKNASEQCASSTFNLFVGGWTTLMFLGLFIRAIFGYEKKKAFWKYKAKGELTFLICRLSKNKRSSETISLPLPLPLFLSLSLWSIQRGTINTAVKHGVMGVSATLPIHRIEWKGLEQHPFCLEPTRTTMSDYIHYRLSNTW